MQKFKPLIFLLFLPALLPAQTNTPVLDMQLVEPHHPSDDLYQKMAAIAAKIPSDYVEEPFLYLDRFLERSSRYLYPEHRETADEFVRLVNDHPALSRPGPRPEWDRQARYPFAFQWTRNGFPLSYQYKLTAMLILEADLHYREGDSTGDKYLWALSRLAGYNYQNPNIGILNFGFRNYLKLAEYMVNYMPPEFLRPEMLDWFPTWEMQIDAYQQSLYTDYNTVITLYRNNGLIDPASSLPTKIFTKTVGFFTFNKDETEGLFRDSLESYFNYLEGPLLIAPDFKTIHRDEAFWFSNQSGQIWVEQTRGIYQHYFLIFATLDAIRDALQLHTALAPSDEPLSTERTRELVLELGLHNVYTDTPYMVTDAGKLLIIPDQDLEPEAKSIKSITYYTKHFVQYLDVGVAADPPPDSDTDTE